MTIPATGIRPAQRSDIPSMHRIRLAVRENRLTSTILAESDYAAELEDTGRGWVAEERGVIVGFAVCNVIASSIWALFVDPEHEGRGHGRRLHDAMIDWLAGQGKTRVWLHTDPRTRAHRFYLAAGWSMVGELSGGEALYELRIEGRRAPPRRDGRRRARPGSAAVPLREFCPPPAWRRR